MSIGVWQSRGVVIAPLSADTPGQPNVIYESGAQILSGTVFKMWFGSINGVCYAESSDGLSWTRYSGNPVLVPVGVPFTGWTGYPKVFKNGGTYYAYVTNKNGLTISSWTSTDGVTWAQQAANAITPSQGWGTNLFQLSIAGQDASGTWWGYYTGYNGTIYQLGRASSTDLLNWTAFSGNPVSASVGGGGFQKVGTRFYYWSQNIQAGIPPFGSNGLPSDISRFQLDSVIGPFSGPLAASTIYRISAAMGVGTKIGQVADPCMLTANGTTYTYATVTPTGNGAPTNYQIACFTTTLSIPQLVQTFEGVLNTPQPSSFGFANQLKTTASDAFTVGDPNWTTMTVVAGWGAPTFGSGFASGTTANVRGTAFWTGSWSADQWASVTVSAETNNSSFVGAMVRGSTSGAATCYVMTWGAGTTGAGSPGTLFYQKFVNGAFTQLGSLAGVTVNIGDVLTISVIGTTLSYYINANLINQITDNSISSGAPGFSLFGSVAGSNAQISAFSAGSFSSTVGGNVGIAGVVVSDGTNSTTSDANGDYILSPEFGAVTITPTLTGRNFSPINQGVTITGAPITGVNFTSGNYSVPDCRVPPAGPNASRTVQGTKIYDVQTSSNPAVPSKDSRAAGAPVDCRVSPNIPQNSRTPGTFGPGE